MSRSSISFATMALLAAVGYTFAAVADQPKPIQNAEQAQQSANPQNAGQQATTGEQNAGQTGAQTTTGQRQPYRVNMTPAFGQNGTQQQRNVDLFLIPCLINANNAEITLGRIAEQKAQSQEVKQFAQEMVKDHTALLESAEQLQTKLQREMRPQNPNATPAAAALFEIGQEVEQTCLTNAQHELEQQSGADFDRCYIGMQVGMHMHVDSALSVFKNHVQSPELKKAVEDAQQIVSRHLDEAKKIAKSLEQQGENNRGATNSSNK